MTCGDVQLEAGSRKALTGWGIAVDGLFWPIVEHKKGDH